MSQTWPPTFSCVGFREVLLRSAAAVARPFLGQLGRGGSGGSPSECRHALVPVHTAKHFSHAEGAMLQALL